MTIRSIASYSFDSWRGNLYAGLPVVQVDPFKRDGVKGLGKQSFPEKPTGVPIVTVIDVASIADANAAIALYLALVGTDVTCIDQHGTSWSTVTVEGCVPGLPSLTLEGDYRLTITWMLIPNVAP